MRHANPKDRNCYCGLWESKPRVLERQGIPEGFCGLCQVCGAPGHTRHFPGAVPYTGCWCDRHFASLRRFHPASAAGFRLWLACACVLALLLWWLLV